ncbi:hypothetical protein HA466_0320560 [Hirschfeldia incana]|nr:hypothetical protein HA466_0320560 [Hirschfeldia incana]
MDTDLTFEVTTSNLPDIQQMVLCKQQEDLEEQPAIDKIQQVDVCQRVELTDLCRQQKQTIMGLEQEVAALKSEGEKLQHKIMELWKFYGGKHQPTPSSAMKQHQYTPSFAMTQKPTPSSFMKQQPTSLFAMTQKKSEETPTLGRGRTKAQAAKRMIGISAHKWKVRATKKSVPEKGEKVVEEEGEKSEREAIDVERG